MKTTAIKRIGATALLVAMGGLATVQAQQPALQYFRPNDQNGLNVFEPKKHEDTVAYTGFKLRVGAHFAQQFQSLSHSNTANAKIDEATGKNLNQLMNIGPGFNLATANLIVDAQLADGIRVNLTTYLSSRHHQETWVKGGYLQVDKLPMLKSALLDKVMENVSIRAGHYEVNYGDAHFRRSDNGNAMYNPLVGNLIMDAFTTEIGGEVVYQHPSGFLAVVGVTGGEIQGGINVVPDRKRSPVMIGKLGYDKQLNEDLRVRLTGSVYTTKNSVRNTLYGGDRAGSRYYLVMENINATPAAQFTSGLINPGMTNELTAVMINPFVKIGGLELFGTLERATGSAFGEPENRTWNQVAAEALYRLPMYDQVYVAGRYNKVSGEMVGGTEISIDRIQAGLGWFMTKNILLKGEYVNQSYDGFGANDIRNGGKFNGVVVEGVIGF
ncbi:hypothetical protein [Cesiribacter andamanensis]|uniref:Phosphate-selective porin n=1 Tax=Cesiribacter andamanensis AMV16 TaxID=1279009 RepID=M7MZE6_9BACT|nr:hypothetical protein [Cesiribacter andamanensis]EMR01788.1 hypothetical protein ADICEAN_03079 [Cesiribacter andamanensis AMV16]